MIKIQAVLSFPAGKRSTGHRCGAQRFIPPSHELGKTPVVIAGSKLCPAAVTGALAGAARPADLAGVRNHLVTNPIRVSYLRLI